MWVYATCVQVPTKARKWSAPLELELEVLESCPLRVLRTTLWFLEERQALLTADPSLQSPPCILNRASRWPGTCWWGWTEWLASPWAPLVFASQSWDYEYTLALVLCGFWRSNSDLRICLVNTSLTWAISRPFAFQFSIITNFIYIQARITCRILFLYHMAHVSLIEKGTFNNVLAVIGLGENNIVHSVTFWVWV